MHFTVFVWGFTAILGRLITLNAVALVWYRLILVVAVLGGLIVLKRIGFRVERKTLAQYLIVGAFVALHWLLFYGCIKYAGVNVAVLCLSTITFFTALIEPVVFRRPLIMAELVLGALVMIGVSLLVKATTDTDTLGLLMGLGSALFSAAFGTFNGHLARSSRAERMAFWELAAASAVTTVFFAIWPGDFVQPLSIGARDAVLIFALAVGCTVMPWLWSLRVLRTLQPYTLALAVSLEPVYAMILARLLFTDAEQTTWKFYLGAAVLVVLVAANTVLKRSGRGEASAQLSAEA